MNLQNVRPKKLGCKSLNQKRPSQPTNGRDNDETTGIVWSSFDGFQSPRTYTNMCSVSVQEQAGKNKRWASPIYAGRVLFGGSDY